MIVYTGRIAHTYPDGIDITVKSGKGLGAIFAPTWDMVMGVKRGQMSTATYTDRYLRLLRTRYLETPQAFAALLGVETRTLQCYCKAGDFCHRVILARDVLPMVAARLAIEYLYGGEH